MHKWRKGYDIQGVNTENDRERNRTAVKMHLYLCFRIPSISGRATFGQSWPFLDSAMIAFACLSIQSQSSSVHVDITEITFLRKDFGLSFRTFPTHQAIMPSSSNSRNISPVPLRSHSGLTLNSLHIDLNI